MRHPRFGAVDQAITAGGWRVVPLLRLSPTIPYSASNYLYGLTGIPFIPYLLASGRVHAAGHVRLRLSGVRGVETVGGRGRSPVEWTLLGIGWPPRSWRRIRDGARPKNARADRTTLVHEVPAYHPHVRSWFSLSSHAARGAK